MRRWDIFRLRSRITEALAPIQLFQCASEKLGDVMLKSDAKLMLKPAKDVLANIKSIAMIKFILGARRAELMRLAQGYDEVFRTFAA